MDQGIAVASVSTAPVTDVAPLQDKVPYETAALGMLVHRDFDDWKTKMKPRHDVWMRSMRNYNGTYDRDTMKKIIENDDSDVFMKITRMMVGIGMSRLTSILLPATGKPWTISPTPIPSNVGYIPDEDVRENIDEVAAYAAEAARRMERQIEDRLVDMRFRSKLLDALLDHTVYGTMVWRGPLQTDRPRTKWERKIVSDKDGNQRALNMKVAKYESQPEYDHISVWKVYPDPYASKIDEATGVIVRHVMSSTQLRRLARSADATGFNAAEINRVLMNSPNGNWFPEPWENDAADATDQESSKFDRFVVLEAWRMCSGEDLRMIGVDVPDDDLLTEKMYQVWVCDGAVIKLEEASYFDRPPFIFCPYEVIDNCIWGRGIPEQMEDSQSAICSLVRGLIDNFALGVGPLLEIKGWKLDPGHSYDKIRPRMTFMVKRTSDDGDGKVVQATEIPVLADKILPVIQFFFDMVQYQTSLPFNLQGMGQEGSGIRTIGQQTMRMQAAESFIRLVVTNVDHKFIEPMISSLYDWEMAFNPDESIKMDMQVEARGVAGAMAREVATMRKMELFQILGNNEVFAKQMKVPNWVDGFIRGFELDREDLVYSAEEMAEIAAMEAARDVETEGQKQDFRRYKAESTDKDSLVALATRIPDSSHAWAPAMANAYKAIGVTDPNLYLALSVHAQRLANAAMAEGTVDAGEHARLSEDIRVPGVEPSGVQPLEVENRQAQEGPAPAQGVPPVDVAAMPELGELLAEVPVE